MVRMVPRLARGTVADVDEQVGEERVTLLAPVGGEVGPHGGGDLRGLVGRFDGSFAFIGQGATGYCECLLVNKTGLLQAANQQTNASGAVHVRSYKAARRLQIRQQGSALAHLLEIVNL